MSEEINIVEEARKLKEELLKEKDEIRQQMEELQSLKAETILSGRSEAGIPAPEKVEKSHDELVTERCNKLLEGTGFKI